MFKKIMRSVIGKAISLLIAIGMIVGVVVNYGKYFATDIKLYLIYSILFGIGALIMLGITVYLGVSIDKTYIDAIDRMSDKK